MNISALSIRHPVPGVLLFILLTVFGIIGFMRLEVQDLPDTEQPTVTISASLEGAAPAQLETEVARKIEDKLTSLRQLDHITTTITEGMVSISVQFTLDKDPNEAVEEVRNAVDSARSELPASLRTPTVSKRTAAPSTLLTYTVASDVMDETQLSWFIDNDVSKAVQSAKGVSTVARIGGVTREVQVDLDPALMAGLGITVSDVSSRLKAMQSDNSGGQGDVGSQRQSFRTLGAVHDPADLAAISIPTATGRSVRLDQLGTIRDTYAERSTRAFHDGKEVIGFTVTRSMGFGDVGVAEAVRKAVDAFAAEHPEVTIKEVANSVDPVIDNYKGSLHLLFEGALLAVIVVWLFLRDWRSTIISAVALPLSIIPTFGVMYLLDYSLDTISLLAIALVIGVLVDDAIVEVENIERHLRMGKRPFKAAMEAADEIGLAVIATTFTLVAVFLPTTFMGGLTGRFFREFGVTASVAVLCSLLVARLLTPMMAAYFLRPSTVEERDGPVMVRYLKAIHTTLTNRRKTVIGATAFFLVSLALIPLMGTGFLPSQDNSQIRVSLDLPPGTTLQETTRVALRAAELAKEIPEVRDTVVLVGSSVSGVASSQRTVSAQNSATLTINLVERGERRLKQSEVEDKVRKVLRQVPGARISMGGFGNGEILQVTLAGDDGELLTRTAKQLETEIRENIEGIGNVTSSSALQQPEIQIQPDYARAAELGVSSQEIANALRLATYGDFSEALPKLNLADRQIDVRVRMDPAIRQDLGAIGQIRLPGSRGQVALESLGELSFGSSASQIDRLDRHRNVTLSVELNGRPLGEVNDEVLQLPTMRNLPTGIEIAQQGELQRISEMFLGFSLAMAIGIFCIYSVLVLLFHDFLQPATILSALPLSIGGAMVALLVTNMSFSMPAVIGLLMLMGIVTKNSILLVEYAIMARRQHGMSRYDALIDACHKRARPIVMTTLAMGAGMLPTALGLGAEPSFRQPMAIVVIGGLVTSTCLSLLVVPVIFTYVDDFEQRIRRWTKRYFDQDGTEMRGEALREAAE